MARREPRKRGMVIEAYSKNMLNTEIRFDKSTGVFRAEVGTTTHEKASIRDLRNVLDEIARQWQPLVWQRVIIVEAERTTEERLSNSRNTPRGECRVVREISISYHVHERAEVPKGIEPEGPSEYRNPEKGRYVYVRALPKTDDEWEAKDRAADAFYRVDKQWIEHDDDLVVIPYSDEALRGLEAIRDGFDHLYERLSKMLKPKTAAAFLASIEPGRLLVAGEKVSSK